MGAGQKDQALPPPSSQFLLNGSLNFLPLTSGLRLEVLRLYFAVTAGSSLPRNLSALNFGGLLVNTLDVRVRRGHAGNHVVGPTAFGHGDFVSLRIDDACLGLVLGLELDFALKRLDLLIVKQVSVLVSVLNLLFLGEDLGLLRDRCLRDDRLRLLCQGLLVLVHDWHIGSRQRRSNARRCK
ncbi:hypothetical protein MKX07_008051 [Trichoderma sp. CBMAI-0711]|nr:hypothetical protein MKX07_008051 [Trichoderma sp. CBMAI-0711]